MVIFMGELLASGTVTTVYPRHKGASKNKGTPKWMVYNETP